jgi:hypothetical protein
VTASEARFQGELIGKLRKIFPNCIIIEPDPDLIQGIPDLLILWHSRWAALECKESEKTFRRPSRRQVNQAFYVELMNSMSFAAFIYPENEEQVLHDLQDALGLERPARLSRRQ